MFAKKLLKSSVQEVALKSRTTIISVRFVSQSDGRKYSKEALKQNVKIAGRSISEEGYKRFMNTKSLLRAPSITRQITALGYKMEKKLISLAEGMPNDSTFPFEKMTITLRGGIEMVIENDEMNSALQYIQTEGLTSLIDTLKTFQERMHGHMDWESKGIVVTTGSQDAIYKSIEMIMECGDPIIVQKPTYAGVDSVIKPLQLEVVIAAEDKYGIVPQQLRETLSLRRAKGLKMPKAMYILPTGTNPSGTVLSNERRREVYEIACEYDFLILEDDAYAFIQFCEETPISFFKMDTEGRVIRFDSLSKVLSSGMRIGWITAPKPLLNVMALHIQASYLHTSTLIQYLVQKIFDTWGMDGFEAHLRKVSDFYEKKRSYMSKSLDKHLTGLAEWEIPMGGMFFWIKVHGVADVYKMALEKAFEKGVMFVPGHAFMLDTKEDCQYIRLTYSRATEEEVDIAIQRLADLIREEQKSHLASSRQIIIN